MLVITFSQMEAQLIIGVVWRMAVALVFWWIVSNIAHVLTGVK